MIQFKSLNELEYTLASKDQMQSYQGVIGWKGKLIHTSPDKFLSLAAKLPNEHYSKESLQSLEQKILNKVPLDPLVLVVDMENRKVVGHEGRHRATIAKKLGIQSVPVIVYTGSSFDRVPKWSDKTHSVVDKLEFSPEK